MYVQRKRMSAGNFLNSKESILIKICYIHRFVERDLYLLKNVCFCETVEIFSYWTKRKFYSVSIFVILKSERLKGIPLIFLTKGNPRRFSANIQCRYMYMYGIGHIWWIQGGIFTVYSWFQLLQHYLTYNLFKLIW